MSTYKGTTKKYTFIAPSGLDLTQVEKVFVTFSRHKDKTEIFTKTGEELTITPETVSIHLTQEESLALPTGAVEVQLNWLYYDENHSLERACSKVLNIMVYKNLKDEVLFL